MKYNIKQLRAVAKKKHMFLKRGYYEVGRGYDYDSFHIILANQKGIQVFLYIFAYE